MPTLRRQLLMKFNKVFDIAAMVFSFALTSLLASMEASSSVPIEQFLSSRVKIQNLFILLVLFLAWQITFRMVGLYRSRRMSTRLQEIIDILKVTTVSTFLLLTSGYIFKICAHRYTVSCHLLGPQHVNPDYFKNCAPCFT